MESTKKKSLLSIQNLLLHEMRKGVYKYADMLPPENVLAERLSISRTQLRDSLSQLEREGFITRRHGVGTIINRHVLSVTLRADMEVEFIEMIRSSGHSGEVRFLKAEKILANELTVQRLNISPGDDVLMVARTVLADGRVTIYCEDYLPYRTIRRRDYDSDVLEKPIFTFMKEYCDTEPYMDLTDIHPAVADEKLSNIFGVDTGTPLLYMDERDFDISGVVVLYARQYYIDGIITHTFLRKKF